MFLVAEIPKVCSEKLMAVHKCSLAALAFSLSFKEEPATHDQGKAEHRGMRRTCVGWRYGNFFFVLVKIWREKGKNFSKEEF